MSYQGAKVRVAEQRTLIRRRMIEELRRGTLKIISTGGTIDKVRPQTGEWERDVGPPKIIEIARIPPSIQRRGLCEFCRKDSLDISPEERVKLCRLIRESTAKKILVTHGTDTMIETALLLGKIPEKVVVFTGAMVPAANKDSDAHDNVWFAMEVALNTTEGTCIAIHNGVYDPERCFKNIALSKFEILTPE